MTFGPGATAPRLPALVLFGLLLSGSAGSGSPSVSERIWHHRNLGKAFYENPATQYKAVDEFKKALELAPDSTRELVNYGLALVRGGKVEAGLLELEKAQKKDPTIPHTWFNLGIAYKRASQYEKATVQLEQMVKLVPDEPIPHYNLGVLYKLDGKHEAALQRFERAAELEPSLAGPHFQLATAYRQAKRTEDAQHEMAIFRELKKRNAGAAVPEELEWSRFAEIYETILPTAVSGPPGKLRFESRELSRELVGGPTGLSVLDADGDGRPDLLAWSSKGVRLYRGGLEPGGGGLEELRDVVAIVPGDFDNDGLADLCVLTPQSARLFHNAGGRYTLLEVKLPAGGYDGAVWLDYDHDYDLDLFLLGRRSRVARNDGSAGFSDRSANFPFVEGHAVAGTRIDLVADSKGTDLAVAYTDRVGVLYRDRLGGNYEAVPLPPLGAGARSLVSHDADNDGWADLAAGGPEGVTLLINDRRQGLTAAAAPLAGGAPPAWADLENRGAGDLLTGDGIYRNQGLGKFAAGSSSPALPPTAAIATADFDVDGRIDVAGISDEGVLSLHLNRTETSNRWLRVGLEGVKNLRLAPGAEIEVKAGSDYQKKIYRGRPLLFGVAAHGAVDTVRITWPNGLIQNEPSQETGRAATYKEAQRLSGSCPTIFTWNGGEFEFITDVLGVAPLGASAGDGKFFAVDNDEYVRIPRQALATLDGRYEIRITEELAEVAYLDEIHLVAVDHHAGFDVFTNDKFKSPPFPEFRLFGIEQRIYPHAARDHRGRDVLDQLRATDGIYVDEFVRDRSGVAELHTLELDFGSAAPDGRAVLVLDGWVDWADGSTFRRISQENAGGLISPYLQVKDRDGRWRTTIEDMGMPAGKPKTIVVDLTGKFRSASREVRIVTSLSIYWDEIFLGEEPAAPAVRLTSLQADRADLDFRGFSEVIVHPERLQPEVFIYGSRQPLSMWNPTPGRYTRFGDVRSLVQSTDDRFVVMGSGDELSLSFDAHGLPDLPAGWVRDFLLFVDGWAKDSDPNTAHSQSVEPLPYHGMPGYPYGETDRFPDDELHRLYREYYNTRPALRLIRPLSEGFGSWIP